MADNTIDNKSYGFGLSAVISIIFTIALTFGKEFIPGLQKWMQGLMFHHWIAHGVFTVVLFLALGFIFSGAKMGEKSKMGASGLAQWITWSSVVSGLALFLMFLIKG